MKEPLKQFEEVLENNSSKGGFGGFILHERNFEVTANQCTSIADNQVIEFTKWLAENDYVPVNEVNSVNEWSNGNKAIDVYDLLAQFKKEFYK